MWSAINTHTSKAVDANMEAIGHLKDADKAIDHAPSSGLAKMFLRDLSFRANNLDTELRKFLLAIQPAVTQEEENKPE